MGIIERVFGGLKFRFRDFCGRKFFKYFCGGQLDLSRGKRFMALGRDFFGVFKTI